MNLFNQLLEMGLIEEWVPVLDWLLNDSRFSVECGWNKQKKTSFTNKIKSQFFKDCWMTTNSKNANWEINSEMTHYVKMVDSGKPIGECFVRHIRNGIAHGRTKIIKQNEDIIFEIYDYKISNTGKKQTAYIKMPIRELINIYELYMEIQNERTPVSDEIKTA